jgi:hypothetical protein
MVSGILAQRARPFAFAASLSLLSFTAQAQERDPAAAQALFDQARELTRQGKFAEACPKLQESNRLDPGIGTQFHLADCYEQSGRVASAWAQFLDVASQARATGQLDREKAAATRAQKLEARLPRLLVNVPEGSKTPGLEIRRNGQLVGSAQWGVPLPVDPGEVELTASAPGKQTLRQTLRAEEGKTASYSVPALAQGDSAPTPTSAPATAAPSAVTVAPQPPPDPVSPDADKPRDNAKARSNNGLVLGLAGLGVVGLGVSGAFAVMAKGKDADSKKDNHCKPNDPKVCDETGVGLRNDAIRDGNVATVAVIAGGVALAGAVVVWLLSGPTEPEHTASRSRVWATAEVGSDRGALYVQGSF